VEVEGFASAVDVVAAAAASAESAAVDAKEDMTNEETETTTGYAIHTK
jgi:hypothetical protein